MLQISGILDRGRSNTNDLATHRHQFESLLDTFRGVHGVAGEHGLHHDRMSASNDHSTPCRVANDNLPTNAALVGKRRGAIAHVSSLEALLGRTLHRRA